METIMLCKKELGFEFDGCLHQIFFEENQEILELKVKYQFDKTGEYFDIL